MGNILCYGDSNTWGYDATTRERLPVDVRWTGVLGSKLGHGYNVIEEGLNGRTTVWDDPIEGYKNGREYFIPCLESHKPLDLITIMLGTNDLKKRFSLSALDIAAGAGVLADIALKSCAGPDQKPPKVLLISPICVGNIRDSEFEEMFGSENSVLTSKRFALYYRQVGEQLGCEFMDAATIVTPSPIDAIHFTVEGHMEFGKAVAKEVKRILDSPA